MKKRVLSTFLAFVLAMGMMPSAALMASTTKNTGVDTSTGWSATGTIGVTLRFDRFQKLDNVKNRKIKTTILSEDGTTELASIQLGNDTSVTQGSYTVSSTLRDINGGTLGGGEYPAFADILFEGLSTGTYVLRMSGVGYKTFDQSVTLENYSQHIVVGTGDATFTLGDATGDNKITQDDWNAVANAVGTKGNSSNDLTMYDFNGDGVIDIIDTAYVNRMQSAKGDAMMFDKEIIPSADIMQLDYQVAGIEPEQVEELLQGTSSVSLPINNETKVATIPIEFPAAIEMEQVVITSPQGNEQVSKGIVTVETVDGDVLTIPFDQLDNPDVHPISTRSGSAVITIALGNRVAVKKITITVEQNDTGEYVAVQSIEFLKDIVPEVPVAQYNQVKNISITAGDESAKLSWTALPNISGYTVRYKEKNSNSVYTEKTVTSSSVTISGLTNGKTYVFTVTPNDIGLVAIESDPVEATPMAASAPLKPSIVSVKTGDATMVVNWTAVKDTKTYKLYLSTTSGTSGYSLYKENMTSTSLTLTELTNDTTYYVYVQAVNAVGSSPASAYASGTPKKVIIGEPEGIPASGRLDKSKIKSISLVDSGNWMAGELALNKGISATWDENYATAWTAKADSSNKGLVVTFTEPVDLSRVIWVPRQDEKYASYLSSYAIKAYSKDYSRGVYVAPSTLSDDKISSSAYPTVLNDPASTKFGVLPLTTIGDITKLEITVLPNKSANPISLSEIIFIEHDENTALDSQITNLFADQIQTTLKDTVTKELLDELQARINSDEINYYFNTDVMKAELDLAYDILDNKGVGVVKNGLVYRNSGIDSEDYKQTASELIPLGMTAQPGAKIAVYVDGLGTNDYLELYASQNNAEHTAWIERAGLLRNGRNVLTVPKVSSVGSSFGGSLYLNDSYIVTTDESNIKVHAVIIDDTKANKIPVLELEKWYEMTEETRNATISKYVSDLGDYVNTLSATADQYAYTNVTEISLPSMLLSIPATAVWNRLKSDSNAVETLYQNTLAWEELIYLANYTQGIEKGKFDATYTGTPMTTRQNIRNMIMPRGAFMYAAGLHIGVGYNSTGALVNGKPTSETSSDSANSLFGWGIAHEIGHNMDKLGKLEVTNNIYALAAQTYDGGANVLPSRLEPLYPDIFSRTAQASGGDSGSVFVQLGMYWQLHLAYDNASDPLGFYNKFFTAWKAGTYTTGLTSFDDKIAVTASKVVNKDLTEFFVRWGRQLSSTAKATMAALPKENRAIWYFSDQSYRDRINGDETSSASGSIDLSASIKDKTVTLNLSPSISGDVQGYEILRNGVSIDFITADVTTYKDTISLLNNRNISYIVKAYDRLGGLIATSDEQEVRISYDNTIDPSEYEISRDENNDVIITFNNITPISGLKITGSNVPTSGTFRATVRYYDDGEKETTAKNGDFSKNESTTDLSSYLTYFNIADENDTRIGVYDATTLVITDLPDDISLEDILVLGYVGDDISFYTENGNVAVGRLGNALDTGDAVIPAGTLVAIGNYRGDPVYNTIEVEGLFQKTTVDASGEQVVTEVLRPMDGVVYLYAEIPANGPISTISDGLFIFVPNVQKEAELNGDGCDSDMLLPTKLKAVLYRTATPNDASSKRMTAETAWIFSPNGDTLPTIVIE